MNPHDFASSFPSFGRRPRRHRHLHGRLWIWRARAAASRHALQYPAAAMAGRFQAQDRRHRRPARLRPLDVAGAHRIDRRAYQCAQARHHRAARRLRRRASQGDALHSLQRMGAGAWRVACPARRARGARQPRLLGRQDGAARRAGTDDRPPRARSRRHSGLRKRRGAADQGRPAVLAGRARRSTGLYAGAALPAGPAHRRRRSRCDAGESDRRCAHHAAGARARCRRAGAGAGRAAALRSYPWRPGAAARLVAGGAVAISGNSWPMATAA